MDNKKYKISWVSQDMFAREKIHINPIGISAWVQNVVCRRSKLDKKQIHVCCLCSSHMYEFIWTNAVVTSPIPIKSCIRIGSWIHQFESQNDEKWYGYWQMLFTSSFDGTSRKIFIFESLRDSKTKSSFTYNWLTVWIYSCIYIRKSWSCSIHRFTTLNHDELFLKIVIAFCFEIRVHNIWRCIKCISIKN